MRLSEMQSVTLIEIHHLNISSYLLSCITSQHSHAFFKIKMLSTVTTPCEIELSVFTIINRIFKYW